MSLSETNSESLDGLIRTTTDLRALERHLLEILEVQQHDEIFKSHRAASRWLVKASSVLQSHVQTLDHQLALLRGSRAALRASTIATSGALIGFLSKARSHEPVKILRDDAVLLSFVVSEYLVLDATATVLNQENLARLATEHVGEIHPLIAKVWALFPDVVEHCLKKTPVKVAKEQLELSH